MIKQSMKTQTVVINKEINVAYHLYFRNALYSIECYKAGFDKEKSTEYCILEDITEDEGEAELFFRRMVTGKVFPIHLKEMVDDLLHS